MTILPAQFTNFRERFREDRTKQALSENRIKNLIYAVNNLYEYLIKNNITDITAITLSHINGLRQYMYKDKQMNIPQINRYTKDICIYLRYLHHTNTIWTNPADGIKPFCPDIYSIRKTRYYTLNEIIHRWAVWLRKRKTHPYTVKNKMRSLGIFAQYIKQHGHKNIYNISSEELDGYKKYLAGYRMSSGKPYSHFSQINHIRTVCQFFLYLYREGITNEDPAVQTRIKNEYIRVDEQYRKTKTPIPKKRAPRIKNTQTLQLFNKFMEYRISSGGSAESENAYTLAVEKFGTYMDIKNIPSLKQTTRKDIMDFQGWLSVQKTKKGIKYAPNTLHTTMVNLKSFFTYLVKCEHLENSPCGCIDLPKKEQGIPRTYMTEKEIDTLTNAPDTTGTIGLRDKTIMEVLYSIGCRAKEIAGLKTGDIDYVQGLCRINEPKGGKSFQRVVPIGKTACFYLKLYLSKSRPVLTKTGKDGYIFLTNRGSKLKRSTLSVIITKHLAHCGLKKKITSHSFRVSCATHMLKNNADIRYVQEQLGHKSIRTTQIYTRLVPKDLKAVHKKCHPRERLADSV